MPPDVVEAMESASHHYVNLSELHHAVGRRIAALVGSEAALVTAGAASALTLGTAACVTGRDKSKIQRLPDTEGMKNEVLIPKAHRNGYDHAVRNVGVKLVDVETAADVDRLVGPRTAMMLYFNVHGPEGKMAVEEYVGLAKKHGIPSLIDAAADIPPASNYSRFLNMGYDLAVFSGGKVLRGPQCSGMLLGRKDLIEAAMLNNSPNTDAIGRTNKVGKEEIVGLWAALERFMKEDPGLRWGQWEKRCRAIAEVVTQVPGVTAETFVPEIANAVPHLKIRWDVAQRDLTPDDVVRKLKEGEPRIEVRPVVGPWLEVAVWMLDPEDVPVVAARVKDILEKK
jgi:L-seryl-tRNA(Ser) seleniumtransferase